MNNEQAAELVARFSTSQDLKLVPMIVAGNTPLRVYLNNDTTTDVLARSLTGAVLADGATGFALWAPPMEPLVFTAAADPGFIDLTYQAGFTNANGQLEYRKVGSQVFLEGAADRTAGDFTTTAETVCILPADAWPARTQRYTSYGAVGRVGRIEITTAGEIKVAVPNNPTATTSGGHTVSLDSPFSWMGLSHTYLTD